MSAQFHSSQPPIVTQPQDTHPPFWRVWLSRSMFQITGVVFWAVAFTAAATGPTRVSYQPWTLIAFAAAALSFTWLLVAPHHPLGRVCSVIVPSAAAGSRTLTLLWHAPIAWTAVIAWAYLLFIMSWVGPRMMPPPLSNGKRRAWLYEAGVK